jgi:AcrR family transcriptional regulator
VRPAPAGVPASARHRSRRGQGATLRQEILDAAAALLAETGNEDAVSIRAVAERVGVTPPSIYLHFVDKKALLEAVCGEAFASFDGHLAAAIAGCEEPMQALRAIGEAYIDFALDRPEHYRFMFMARAGADVHEPTDAELQSMSAFSRLIEVVAACQDCGAIDPAEDPMRVAQALWAGVHGLAALLIAKPYFPWGDVGALREHVLDMCLRGVAAVPAPRGATG